MAKPRRLVSALLGACLAACAPGATTADPLNAALEERIGAKAGLGDVEITAWWQLEQGGRSARIWGNGVGVWKQKVQFRLSRDEVVSLLKMLLAADFGSMRPPASSVPPNPTAGSPRRLVGELTVVVGSLQKTLQQRDRGEQSEPLRELIQSILNVGEKAAKAGVTASSLQDGLRKLSAGTLAPETFEAVAQRREDPKGASAGESWLLRLNGLRITDRLMPKGQAPPPPRILTLSREDLLRLARLLEENDPGALPNKLYAPAYTDVRIEVFGQGRTIPARAYLGVTRETHGARQQAFDRLYEAFRALHERAQKDGTPDADPERKRYPERARPNAEPAPTSSPAAP
ncbi:MAG: hypothetical protein WEB59_11100 [Thermoanaerobaculia bacterium]